MKLKDCKVCKIQKNIENFYKHKKTCIDCFNLLRRAKYPKLSKKLNKQRKIWRNNNKEKVAKSKKMDYIKNKPKRLATIKKYANNNRPKVNKISAKYHKANPEKVNFLCAKRRADKLNRTPKWLTKGDWIEIQMAYDWAKQLSKETGILHEVDHIIPLRHPKISGLHCPQNLQVISSSENRLKNNKFPYVRGN